MHASLRTRFGTTIFLVALVIATAALAQSASPDVRPKERIKAFCVDFNWVGGRFAAPGTFAHADPKVHYQWYKDLGVNVIHTFCVSCDGYAWYRDSSVAPVEPGLKHDFLKEITSLAHKDGIRVMGYFCVGANALWARKHPDQAYGDSQGIAIPLTTEYLDYLTASMKDVLLKTGIDGFQLDWMFSPPLLSAEKNVRWLACEQKMYEELFGRPFPGKEKVDAQETAEFQRRALARCWQRIRETAKSTRPDCIVWLSCYDLKSPQVVGSKMLQQADWLVNEHPDPAYIEAVRKQIGTNTKIIQCLTGWMEHDPGQTVGKLANTDVGFYGFAMADPKTTLPKTGDAARPGSLSEVNARNIEQLRKIYHQEPTARRALLIGCTQYDKNPSFDLKGPANDLVLMRKVLVDRLRFSEKNIVELGENVGQTHPENRPTRANIERAFQRLARETQPGDQVLIFLAGHGSQQPERAGDERTDLKPDGMAEIFLPADVGRWNGSAGEVTNAIADRDFRAWIKAILDKGAFVFGIVDACHSGTMLRGDSDEVVRGVAPEALGIPAGVVDRARQRAAAQVRGRGVPGDEGMFSDRDMPAHFVALYACQSREPTLERPLPPDQAKRVPHGLLTFAVCQTLENAARSPSYRELFESVQSRYVRWGHADRPVPLMEGRALDDRILDTVIAPARRQYLIKRGMDGWTIPVGLLADIGPGSILALGADKRRGYVRVADSGLLTSIVEPHPFGGLPPPTDEQLLGAMCEPVQIVLGMSKLKVGFDRMDERGRGETTPLLDRLERGLKQLAASRAGFEVVDDVRLADWLVQMRDGKPLLLPADAARLLGELAADTPQFRIPAEKSAETLADCLDRIARVRNLQDLIGFSGRPFFGSGTASEGENPQQSSDVLVDLTMYRLRNRHDKSGEPICPNRGRPSFRPGDWVAWKMSNHSEFPVGVAMFFIDADYHVHAVFPPPGVFDNQIEANKSRWFGPARVNAKTTGIERVLLLAVKSQGAPVDLGILAEPRWDPQRGAGLDSPLQRLLKDAMFPDGGVRGISTDIESYAGRTVSWRVVAESVKHQNGISPLSELRPPDNAQRSGTSGQLRRALLPPREKPAALRVQEETPRSTAAELYAKVAPATVLVRTPGGIGTGILVGDGGWVLTNHHVIFDADCDPVTGAQRPWVYLGRMEGGSMQLLPEPVATLIHKDDEAGDLALLKLVALPKGSPSLPVIPLAKTRAKPGEPCVVIGHPRAAMLWTIREGLVSSIGKWPGDQTRETVRRLPAAGLSEEDRKRLAADYARLPQMNIVVSNCGINFGDSGGPLVNQQGELIGLTFAMPSSELSGGSPTNFSYHIALEEVQSFLAVRPKEPLLYVPDPWAIDAFGWLTDVDGDGTKETMAFGPNPGDTPTAMLVNLSDPKTVKAPEMSIAEICRQRAWHFQLAVYSAPATRVFYDTDNAGRINLILMENAGGKGELADHVLRLVGGKWQHEAAKGQRLLDPSLLTDQAMRERLQKIFEKLQKSK